MRRAAPRFSRCRCRPRAKTPDDWAGLEQCIARFVNETGCTPTAVHHAAGAIRYSYYDFFKRLALTYIAGKHGRETVPPRDYDLTDYDALRVFALGFAGMETQR